MSTPTTGSLVIKHPNSLLRVNERGGRIYITMSLSVGNKITMALSADEAIALATYLQTKSQLILSKGGFIGVRGSSTSTSRGSKARKARAKPAEAKGEAKETTPAPKQTETEETGEEDIGEEE